MKQERSERLEELDARFADILRARGHIIAAFIKKKLFQFNLYGQYSENDILSQTYLRAVDTIYRGVEIQKLAPWIRSTSFNIIREISRQKIRRKELHYDSLDEILENEQHYEETILDKLDLLNKALFTLKDDEEQLIYLSVVQGLSWKEIKRELNTDESLATLRKRKERALKRLRVAYHELNDEE